MAEPTSTWEDKLKDAASHLEHDVRRVITYLNDEVVPDVRRHGSSALRTAATELQKLAERMDEHNRQPPPRP